MLKEISRIAHKLSELWLILEEHCDWHHAPMCVHRMKPFCSVDFLRTLWLEMKEYFGKLKTDLRIFHCAKIIISTAGSSRTLSPKSSVPDLSVFVWFLRGISLQQQNLGHPCQKSFVPRKIHETSMKPICLQKSFVLFLACEGGIGPSTCDWRKSALNTEKKVDFANYNKPVGFWFTYNIAMFTTFAKIRSCCTGFQTPKHPLLVLSESCKMNSKLKM